MEEICRSLDDWDVFLRGDLPPAVWERLRDERFFGMIIPEEWGGLGFSARLRYGSNFPVNGYFKEIDGTYYAHTEKNRERLPAYARLDLRGERTFIRRRSRITVFVETLNTLNRRNAAQGSFGINFNNLVDSDLLEEGLPLLPSVGLLLEF